MNSTDYDRVIAQERKVLASIQEHGEKFILDFKKVTAAYIRDWAIKLVKDYFTHRPEVTKTLGAEKQGELKREFTSLLDKLPEKTSQRLDDSQIWLHRMPIPDQALSDMSYSYQLEKRSNKYLDRAIRDLIAEVGSILIKYGFIEVDENYDWEMIPGGIPRYVGDLPSRGMDHYRALSKLMDQYKDILVEYVYAIQNLRKAEQAKRSAEADGF